MLKRTGILIIVLALASLTSIIILSTYSSGFYVTTLIHSNAVEVTSSSNETYMIFVSDKMDFPNEKEVKVILNTMLSIQSPNKTDVKYAKVFIVNDSSLVRSLNKSCGSSIINVLESKALDSSPLKLISSHTQVHTQTTFPPLRVVKVNVFIYELSGSVSTMEKKNLYVICVVVTNCSGPIFGFTKLEFRFTPVVTLESIVRVVCLVLIGASLIALDKLLKS